MNADLDQLPDFARQQQLARIPGHDVDPDDDDGGYGDPHEPVKDIDRAHVVTSATGQHGLHRPVLDIDFGAAVLPSTTPGHYHLYLDTKLPWKKYRALLRALADAGIIEPGYANASIARQYTSVRLPWIRKAKR